MATVDLSRTKNMHLKKTKSYFYVELDYSDILTSANVYQLMKFPKEVLVTRCVVVPITAFNSATSAVLDVGVVSGSDLQNDSDLKATAGTVDDSGTMQLRLPTGGILTVTPVYVGAPTAGKVGVLVEYLEYGKTSGELTSFVA